MVISRRPNDTIAASEGEMQHVEDMTRRTLVLVRKMPYRRDILLGKVATRSAAADEVKPLPQS
jgi:hypothetical protein